MRTVVSIPLTADGFAAFGQVVSAGLREGNAANQGTAVRFDHCAELISTRPGAKPNLAVFRSKARALPIELQLLERHPCSTQVFLPMVLSRYLVCVAPPLADGSPDVERLVAFVCAPGQGIAYAPNVWHHPMVALDAPGEFAMLAWEDGGPRDCEEFPLVQPIRVT